ncbi:DEAD/DEAH box helicase, putative [Cordyceps militaris CM01]|uniref:DEAD/DEAH box helicase, putative n=1 Tax=Cordyceps militaris (strain CM01) TaxID=983644 RepID=G3JCS0_CORMM|nr:DEAD/DEAH box helicase, putative [Cordyceps militaris CM01]EGX94678.1 DEAD/DEAH box helicase, putative [Cordyceps militaris CM01]
MPNQGIPPPKTSGAKRKRLSARESLDTELSDSSMSRTDPATDSEKTKLTSKSPSQGKAKKERKQDEEAPPWPALFVSLDRTHRALNLVFTFCSTRKHFTTTFAAIRPAVESHIKRKLSIEEVAKIVAVRPEGINFSFVDKSTLELDIKLERKDDSFKLFGNRKEPQMSPDASVGGWTGVEALGASAADDHEVLFFEFIDGDLKRQVPDKKTGEPTNPQRRLRDEKLQMPVFGQGQMTKLIERRNQRFTSAVNAFLKKCVDDKLDPCMALEGLAESYVPKPSEQDEDSDIAVSTIPATIPKDRKPIPEIVKEIRDSAWYTGQIVPDGHRVFDSQEPVHGDLAFLLSQNLVNAIYNAKGIASFYAHQAEALNALHEGKNVVVATSTSSGKSLIYQLPVLYALEQDFESRAMYIFPTKALAQDQRRSLKDMMAYMPGLEGTVVETFDGDTPFTARNAIREQARIIFTNPDMLHVTILPQEEKWRSFLKNLQYVVVDELHYYNGQLGSHVAFIMRRLRRICAAIGNRSVQFISCSATVANPTEHFKAIFGIDNVKLIDFDGSPSGRKEFLCWNTPYKDPGDPASGRGSAKFECARLFCELLLRGVRIIAFCRVRNQCEVLVNAIRQELENRGRGDCVNLVMGYRGGYTAEDRRKIESEMFAGRLLGIVSTTALELGIDIGTLDCVLTWGFPYTIANLRQQSGRAGRRNKDSLSILLGDCFPTDQHYMQNPEELFSKPTAELRLDLDNMLVREGHIQCAAFEMPIRPEYDTKYFGRDLAQICEERLVADDMGYYHCHDRFRPKPSKFVAIRDTEDEHFAVIDITHGRNVVLEELEASRATFTIYDGGIFLHQGRTYLVRDFLPDRRMAKVERVKVDWLTSQRDYTNIDPVETEAIRDIGSSGTLAYHGTIKILQKVFGFFKIDSKGRVLDAVQVDNRPIIRYTKGMWLDIPKSALDILNSHGINAAASIHAAQHCVMSLLPTFVISAPEDVRTECKVALKEFATEETARKRPGRLTFYDAKGGAHGSGISTKAFEHIDHLLQLALQRVESCRCMHGCIECVASELCKDSGEVMSKAGSRVILQVLLGIEVDVDALGQQGQELVPAGIETVVVAQPVPMRRRRSSQHEPMQRQGQERRWTENDEGQMGGFERG